MAKSQCSYRTTSYSRPPEKHSYVCLSKKKKERARNPDIPFSVSRVLVSSVFCYPVGVMCGVSRVAPP